MTSKPFGEMTISPVLNLSDIHGVGRNSSTWQVLDAFVRQNEAVAARVAFGSSGAIIMTAIPGDPTSGMFYMYDARTRAFSMLEFSGKENFTPSLFDVVMGSYGLDELIATPVQPSHPHHNHRRHSHRGGRRMHFAVRREQQNRQAVAA